MTPQTDEKIRYDELPIDRTILASLKHNKITHPTPIQERAIPIGLQGKDILGIAQTGTGKTLAFSIPILQKLKKSKEKAIIIAPTRELAMQIAEEVAKFTKPLKLKSALLIGGTNMAPQRRALRQNPQIIIATPGRIIDHIHSGNLDTAGVTTFVLDEADRMLDMGFMPQIQKIASYLTQEHQTMLFSATMPKEIEKLAHTYMKEPVRVEVAKEGTSAEKIDQEIYITKQEKKLVLLIKLLQEHSGSTLIFCRTKRGASKLATILNERKLSAEEIHSNRSLGQRKRALEKFKKGRCRILVATDIAARGIDVKEIQLVINYDLPEQMEDYVHRIGRTGRAGKSGKAISFVTPAQTWHIPTLEKSTKKKIPTFNGEGDHIEVSTKHPKKGNNKKRRPKPFNKRGDQKRKPFMHKKRSSFSRDKKRSRTRAR